MGKKKKIAIGIIAVGIIIVLLMSVPMPGLPVRMSIGEFLRNYLLLTYDIELPEIFPTPKPEIIPKGKIAFAVIPDYDYGSIYIADADGKNITLLIKDIRIRGDIAWSPDGQKIAFIGIGGEVVDGNIYVVNMRGKISRLVRLSQMRINNLDWSPDGKYIVFEATSYQKIEGNTTGMSGIRIGNTFYAEAGSGIYIMNADGTNITKIVEKGKYPAWSPDGKKIIFISCRENEYGKIYIINTNDGNITKLTIDSNITKITIGESFTWRPDGKKIAFVCWIGETQQICVMNVDGTNLTIVTNFQGVMNIKELNYSPDGKKIAFVSGSEIYIINADGTNLTKLAEGNYPTWSPP